MPYDKNVFINCPFDKEYYPLLRPLIFTIVYLGYNPRITLEKSDSGTSRLEQLLVLISESKYSIHDLSRLQATKKKEFYRLNMPFELGIDYSSKKFSESLNDKEFLILETKEYDYMKAISDINGLDIKAHGDKPLGIIKCIRNWFVETVGLKKLQSPTQIWYLFTDFYGELYDKKKLENFSNNEIDFMPIPEFIDEIKESLKS